LYAVIADYVERLFPDGDGAFFAYSASRDDLEQKAAWRQYGTGQESMLIKPGECWGLRRGRAHRLDIAGSRMRCAHMKSAANGSICAPVLGPDETIGLLHLRFDEDVTAGASSRWDEREQLAVTAAEYIGLSLVNLRLRMALQQQSIRDPLTGLFNRRFLEETLVREIRRAQRSKNSLCVLMLDIDHFKTFNDRYGHAAGDVVLREFSSLLSESIRGADSASRYGGEEFTVLLFETGIEGGRTKAETLLERTRGLRLSFNGLDVGIITASAGIAAYPGGGEHAEDLLRAADTALYAAKQAGRDRVAVRDTAEPGTVEAG
jgi:diguanylate cyclase (GGDEF)-like protein